jgi:hypothetical protein
MDIRERYKATTLRILGKFQLIEFGLKHYIGFSYQLIQKRLDGEVHFDYSIEDVENHPLERLLNTFSKLNGNLELQGRLNALRVKRNHVAHKSLLVSFGWTKDSGPLEKADEEFFHLEDEVHECLQAVRDELFLIKTKLYGPTA